MQASLGYSGKIQKDVWLLELPHHGSCLYIRWKP